jgi:hypothetical protein
MRSGRRGKSTLVAEVANVSANGFWLLLDERELFVPFEQFPWFRAATIGQLVNVQRPHEQHLYWPDLDVDLAVDSIEHPERYPLVSKARPNTGRQRPGRASRPARSRATRQAARR